MDASWKVNIFIAFLAIGNTASLNIAILSFMRSMTLLENKWWIQTWRIWKVKKDFIYNDIM